MRRSATVMLVAALAATAAAAAAFDDQRGRGRGGVVMMSLTPDGWTDGGMIPAKHAQAGEELSPALRWSGAPEGVESFVLIVHDVDVRSGDGTSDLLYWMLWNIPATATSLPEGVPSGDELPDGTRQISVSGPYYRGPAAAADDPTHHVVFDLYALDTTINVRPGGASVAETREAVMAAMAGRIRGKATLVGLVPGARR